MPAPLPLPRPGTADGRIPDHGAAVTVGIVLISFTKSVATARTFCQRDDAAINANSELLAVGAAKVASALVGGLPAGARSQMAQGVSAIVILIVLPFLSPLISLLPQAAPGRECMFFNLRKALETWQQRSERPTFTNENPLPFGGSGTPK
jgi:hypothetical protein